MAGVSGRRGRATVAQRDQWLAFARGLRERAASDLARGVAAARTAGGWGDLLRFAAGDSAVTMAFHNVLLLHQQLPTATRVLQESHWHQLDRRPARGSTALRVWQPRRLPRGQQDLAAGEAAVAFAPPDRFPSPAPNGPVFLLAAVFDVSQTTGGPLPAPAGPVQQSLHGETVGAWEELVGIAAEAGFEVQCEDLDDDRSGFVAWDDRVIVVAGGVESPDRCSSLIEQLVVLRLGRGAGGADAGLVAASSAAVAAHRFALAQRPLALPEDWGDASVDRVRAVGEATMLVSRDLVHRMQAAGVGADHASVPTAPAAPRYAAVGP